MHIDLMRDKAKVMPDLGAVDSLRIWHCKYKTLQPVSEVRSLRTLVIATFPEDSLSILAPLRRLRYLSILHLPHVSDLSPLAQLGELESLSLATLPSWDSSGKVTEVASLDPLGQLQVLRHVELFGVVPKTRSLKALERCRNLVSGRFSKYPEQEVRRFYEATGVSDNFVPEPEAGQ